MGSNGVGEEYWGVGLGGAGNKYYMTGSAEGIFWTAIKMNDISCAPVTMKNSFWTVRPSSLFLSFFFFNTYSYIFVDKTFD